MHKSHEKIFYGVMFLLCILLFIYALRRFNGLDFYAYLRAAQALVEGQNPYLFQDGMPYRYLPGVGLGFIPLLKLSPSWIFYAVTLLSLLSLARATYCLASLYGYFLQKNKISVALSLVMVWVAINQGLGAQLEGGNINVFLFWATVEAFFQFKRCNIGIAALLDSLVLLVKPYLALFFS